MGRSRQELGDKLGPRLAQLFLQSQVAARHALAPYEARVHTAASQAVIDRLGADVASLFAPYTAQLLASDGLSDETRRFIERAASGTHQGESIVGHALLGLVGGSVLGTVISNELAPFGYGLVGLNPHLQPDPPTTIGLVATGWLDEGTGIRTVAEQGYHTGWFTKMLQAAWTWPAIEQILDLLNRGGISQSEAVRWMEHAGLHPLARPQLLGLARVLTTPADAALAVVRSVITRAEGEAIARQSGVHGADFRLLEAITGEPLGLQQLQEALRRKFIDPARFKLGLLESRVRNEWLDVAEALRYAPVPTADAVDAWLRGHLAEAETRQIAEQNGVEPGQVQILLDDAGSPPGDIQLLELWRRGKITEARTREGLRFGRLRNEWIPDLLHLRYDPLPAAEAVDAWLRGHVTEAEAVTLAERAGLDPAEVPIALANAGNPLPLQQLLEAFRRGFIDEARFTHGFRQSRYRDEWVGTALELRHSPMSTADAVEASIQGHLTKAQARQIAEQNGLLPADFDPLWQTAGMPLSRTEAEQLYNRGLISRAVVEQALRESRLKDKYIRDAVELHVRLPEPRQVVTALTEGVVTRAYATRLLADEGYEPRTVAMLIAEGEVKATGPHRQLLTGEISALYADRIVSGAEATKLLEQLHYTGESAALILRLADYSRQRRIIDSGITAVKAHFLAHRIDATTAAGDLHAMGLPASTSDLYLKVWRLDRLAHPRQLTEAQIVKANKLELFVTDPSLTPGKRAQANYDAALARLVALGYDNTDAGLLLNGA